MRKIKHILSILLIALPLSTIKSASLPPPYEGEGFQGFHTVEVKQEPFMLVTEPGVDAYNLGDPCPCPNPHAPGLGFLIVDPYDSDGLTCNDPSCPCGYDGLGPGLGEEFWGFPLPLTDGIIPLLIMSSLYSIFKFKKRKNTEA